MPVLLPIGRRIGLKTVVDGHEGGDRIQNRQHPQTGRCTDPDR